MGEKKIIIGKPAAERGSVYEFKDNEGKLTTNYALVISSNTRAHDKYVSILMINDYASGPDVISVPFTSGKQTWNKQVHCGMVSYASRERLGNKIGYVPEEAMNKLSARIACQLGLAAQTDYKTLYEDLLDRLIRCKNVSDMSIDAKISNYM